MVSVQAQIELEGDLSLTSLSRKLDKINLPKQILQTALTKLQDNLIQELCQTTPYVREPDKQFQRAGTTQRTLKTRHGTIELKLVIVHNLENNSYFRPLLLYLGVSSRQRIVDDLDLECAETATYLPIEIQKPSLKTSPTQPSQKIGFMLTYKK